MKKIILLSLALLCNLQLAVAETSDAQKKIFILKMLAKSDTLSSYELHKDSLYLSFPESIFNPDNLWYYSSGSGCDAEVTEEDKRNRDVDRDEFFIELEKNNVTYSLNCNVVTDKTKKYTDEGSYTRYGVLINNCSLKNLSTKKKQKKLKLLGEETEIKQAYKSKVIAKK